MEACVKDQEKETFKTKKRTVVILLSRLEKFITVLQFETLTTLRRQGSWCNKSTSENEFKQIISLIE